MFDHGVGVLRGSGTGQGLEGQAALEALLGLGAGGLAQALDQLRREQLLDVHALLGQLADATNIETVYGVCAYLPLIGLLTAFLPRHPGRATLKP